MAAQKGRDMLIKIKDDQDAFVTVAGLRTKNLKFNSKTIDVTHSESDAAWRELLPGAGIKSVEISGQGIFSNSDSDALVRTSFFAQTARNYQMIIPDFGMIEGDFIINSLHYTGSYNGEANYEITLMSAGKALFLAL